MSRSDNAHEARLYGGEVPEYSGPPELMRCDVCDKETIMRELVENPRGDVWAGPCCLAVAKEAARLETDLAKFGPPVVSIEEEWARALAETNPVDAFASEVQ